MNIKIKVKEVILVMLYYDKTLNRINSIIWKEINMDTKVDNKNTIKLIKEYLKNIALFSFENKIEFKNPFSINVGQELGYYEEIDLHECCTKEANIYFETNIYIYFNKLLC